MRQVGPCQSQSRLSRIFVKPAARWKDTGRLRELEAIERQPFIQRFKNWIDQDRLTELLVLTRFFGCILDLFCVSDRQRIWKGSPRILLFWRSTEQHHFSMPF